MLSEQQLAIRRTGIGSSEIGAIAGWDPFKDELDVWMEKVGWAETPGDTAATSAGKWLEDGILARAAFEQRWTLQRCRRTFRSSRYSWALATPDRFRLIERKRDRIVECKSSHAIDTVEGWGEDWSAKVPRHIRAQVQWQMTVTGVRSTVIVVLLTFQDRQLHFFEVPHSQNLEDALLELGDRFWNRHVIPIVPPEIDYARPSARRFLHAKYKRPENRIDAAPLDSDAWAARLLAAKRDIADAEERETLAENILKRMVGDARGIAGPWGKFTWSITRGNVNTKNLADHLMDQMAMPEPERTTLRERFREPEYRKARFTPKET